ncbi:MULTISPECIES: hypothetical protein [Yersinia]|uniref:Uncharacterized protein n=1 Tax=Yersinia proxima TaxID=2890316 RepID=A0ABW9F1G9_9GAMM
MNIITKQDGFNESERYLAGLCNKTFLSLWSYPNVYTDEGKKSENGDGKELCDLLVVFDNHVIIFSDKDIGFKDSGNIEVDWGRWVKRAVIKSSIQLYGAESSLKERPERLFLDAKCHVPFPIKIPNRDVIKVHRIAVAKNASKRFQSFSGGSGSLIIYPEISGEEHIKHPFMIGRPVTGKPFVHVFDDVALDIILSELDTIADLIDYLEKKERFIDSGGLHSAAGEEELLAWYFISTRDHKEPGFYIEEGTSATIIEGAYEALINLPQYKRGKEYNGVSYFWDECIENFSRHILSGTLIYNSEYSVDEISSGLRIMAAERRVCRRILSDQILQKVRNTPREQRAVRVLISPTNSDNGYVWLAEPIPTEALTYEDYRKYRKELLYIYCTSAKLLYPQMKYVVGVATEPVGGNGGEDMVYIDTTTWAEANYEQARKDRDEFKILSPDNVKMLKGRDYQFPIHPEDYPKKELSQKRNIVSKKKQLKKAQRVARKRNRSQR